jgi:hypothetical protein
MQHSRDDAARSTVRAVPVPPKALDRREGENAPRCVRPLAFVDVETGEVRFIKPCGSWRACGPCREAKAASVRARVTAGIQVAQSEGEPWGLLTVTGPPEGLSVAALGRALRCLLRSLRRSGGFRYATVVHPCSDRRRGVHAHVVVVGREMPPKSVLRQMAVRSGFGRQVDWRVGGNTNADAMRVGRYLANQLVVHGPALVGPGGRVRPLRASRDWDRSGVTAAAVIA